MTTKKSVTTTEKKSVVKTDVASLPMTVEELELMSGQGFEGADKDAFAIPFLRILQQNSPQCNEDEESYIEGAKAGMFFNTVTGALFGKEIKVIPVQYNRDFIEWLPNRGGFIKSHGSDPAVLDRIVQVDEKNNSILDNENIIQDTKNHFVLLADHISDGPIILSLSSTGIKHSRKWMTLMQSLKIPNTNKTAPMFASTWILKTVMNENDEGKWYQIGNKNTTSAEFDGWVNKEQLEIAISARELVMSGNAKADWDSTVDQPAGNQYEPGSFEDEDEKGPF